MDVFINKLSINLPLLLKLFNESTIVFKTIYYFLITAILS